MVFDARKRAEHSKQAREGLAGTGQSTEPGPHSSNLHDAAPVDGDRPGVSSSKATAAQQAPIVRSLLRMPRAAPLSGAPGTSTSIRENGKANPGTLILRDDPAYPAVAKEQLISGSV